MAIEPDLKKFITSLYKLPENMRGTKMSITETIKNLLGKKRLDLTSKKETILSNYMKGLSGHLAGYMYQLENHYNHLIIQVDNEGKIPEQLNIDYYIRQPHQIKDVRKKKSGMITVIVLFLLDDYNRMNVTEKNQWENIVSIGVQAEKLGINIEFQTFDGNNILPSVCQEKLPKYVKRDAYGREIKYEYKII